MTNALPTSYSMGKNYKHSPTIRYNTGMSTLPCLIQHSARSPSHRNQTRRSKKHPNWKGRSKTVFLWRLHDTVHREPQRFHQETTITDQ